MVMTLYTIVPVLAVMGVSVYVLALAKLFGIDAKELLDETKNAE